MFRLKELGIANIKHFQSHFIDPSSILPFQLISSPVTVSFEKYSNPLNFQFVIERFHHDPKIYGIGYWILLVTFHLFHFKFPFPISLQFVYKLFHCDVPYKE